MAVNVVLKSVWDNKGLSSAEKAFDGLGKSIGKIGAGIAAAFSVNALLDFAKAAAEDAKSAALLESQLKNTVAASDELVASVEESIKQMQLSSAVADDQLRPAMAQLVRTTGDAAQAQRLLQIALDVSAATGRDLGSVSIALSKAYNGQTTALSRLGIKAQEGVNIFDQLEKQFAGAAETAARNDPFQRLTVIFGELQEQIGSMFLPYLNDIADYFASADFQTAFTKMGTSIGEAMKAIDRLFIQISGSNALTFFINLVDAAAVGLAQIAFVAGDAASTLGKIFTGDFAGAGKAFSTFLTRYNKFVQDIYKRQDEAAARAKSTGTSIFTGIIPTPPGKGGARGAKGPSAFEQVQKIIKDAQKKLAEASTRYNEAVAKANAAYSATIREAEKTYSSALAEATAERDRSLADALADHTKNIANIQRNFAQRQADIIQQSIDRLRDAYQSAVRVNVADLFRTEEVAKSVDTLVQTLRDRLTASRTLVSNAAQLASQGFSQTFIEQIVGAGLETGNELSKAILEATPETQRELQSLFGALETESETGMDSLARTMFEKTGLATTELKKLFAQTEVDLVETLKQAQIDYTNTQTEILKTFDDAMLQAQRTRDDAFASANERLQEALSEARDAYIETVEAIKAAFLEQIEALEGALGGLGKTVEQLIALMNNLLMGTQGPIKADFPTISNGQLPSALEGLFPSIPATTAPGAGGSYGTTNQYMSFNIKVDPTQSPAMVGAAVAKSINKYTGGGGGLRGVGPMAV